MAETCLSKKRLNPKETRIEKKVFDEKIQIVIDHNNRCDEMKINQFNDLIETGELDREFCAPRIAAIKARIKCRAKTISYLYGAQKNIKIGSGIFLNQLFLWIYNQHNYIDQVNLKADCPYFVTGSQCLLLQVFDEMIKNSWKYRRIDKKKENKAKVDISVIYSNNDYVIIEYSDEGTGIPESMMEEVFDPGRRFHDSRDGILSDGLGMSFVKKAIKAMDGEISILSSDSGIKFHIKLVHG